MVGNAAVRDEASGVPGSTPSFKHAHSSVKTQSANVGRNNESDEDEKMVQEDARLEKKMKDFLRDRSKQRR